jgi:hypothetical protein
VAAKDECRPHADRHQVIAGRKTGESEVTLWRGGVEPTLADDILLTVGNRSVWSTRMGCSRRWSS